MKTNDLASTLAKNAANMGARMAGAPLPFPEPNPDHRAFQEIALDIDIEDARKLLRKAGVPE